jgi:hypothetical protein
MTCQNKSFAELSEQGLIMIMLYDDDGSARIMEAPNFFYYDPGSTDPLDIEWYGFGQWDDTLGSLNNKITEAGVIKQAKAIYDSNGNLLIAEEIYDAIAALAIDSPVPSMSMT